MKSVFLWLMLVMVIFHLQISAGTFCDDKIFLRVGSRGVIACDFGMYEIVGWLNPTADLETTLPFIYLEGSEIRGPESRNGEYSILPNGSLIIENVTISHEKNYTVRIVKNHAVSHLEVPVKVYVLPVPEYPVVNGRTDQERIVVHSANGRASLRCTMDHIRPAVPLELVFISPISNGISVMTIPSTLNNPDGTCNVSLDIQLTAIDLPDGIYLLQCRVAGSFSQLFPSTSAIDLSVFDGRYNFPLVNGLDRQQHVVLNVKREGTINCSINRVSPSVFLQWDFIKHYSLAEVALERHSHYFVYNEDGTYSVTSILGYKTTSESVKHVTLKCVVSDQAAVLYPLFTTVELNFPATDGCYNFPLVNGLDNLQHVVLNVKREGTLNCSMNRVLPNIYLEWDFIKHYSSSEISLERQGHSTLDNGDGTYNITSITSYKITSDSVQYVTLQCMVSGKLAGMYPLFTTVELNLSTLSTADAHSSSYSSHLASILFIIGIAIVVMFTSLLVIFYVHTRKQMQSGKNNKTCKVSEDNHWTEQMLTLLKKIEIGQDREKGFLHKQRTLRKTETF